MITLWFPKIFFSLIQHDCRLCVIERIESDHMPLELHTNVEEMIGPTAEVDKNEYTDKFVWKDDYAQQSSESMHSDKTKEQLSLASSLILTRHYNLSMTV